MVVYHVSIHVIKVCVYTLSKVVSHYDLSVLSMYVMGLKKTICVGGEKVYPVLFWIFNKI